MPHFAMSTTTLKRPSRAKPKRPTLVPLSQPHPRAAEMCADFIANATRHQIYRKYSVSAIRLEQELYAAGINTCRSVHKTQRQLITTVVMPQGLDGPNGVVPDARFLPTHFQRRLVAMYEAKKPAEILQQFFAEHSQWKTENPNPSHRC